MCISVVTSWAKCPVVAILVNGAGGKRPFNNRKKINKSVYLCSRFTSQTDQFTAPLKEVSPKSIFFVFTYSNSTISFSSHRSCSLFPDEIRLEKSDLGARHFETVLAARPCLCDVTLSDSKLAGRRKNLQLTWHPSQGHQNLFFPSD